MGWDEDQWQENALPHVSDLDRIAPEIKEEYLRGSLKELINQTQIELDAMKNSTKSS